MKKPLMHGLTIFVSLIVFQALAFADVSYTYNKKVALTGANKMWLNGLSTLHPWSTTANALILDLDLSLPDGTDKTKVDNEAIFNLFKTKLPVELRVTVPISEIKHKDDLFNSTFRGALNAEKYPNIVFKLTDYKVTSASDSSLKIVANGNLTLNNTTKSITLDMDAKLTDKGIRIKGAEKMLMTDFKVQPPVILIFIRTEDSMTVNFDLTLDFEKNRG